MYGNAYKNDNVSFQLLPCPRALEMIVLASMLHPSPGPLMCDSDPTSNSNITHRPESSDVDLRTLFFTNGMPCAHRE